jgi:hypothetical protein
MILATLVDRGSEGSSSAQRLLECRQRYGNPMKSTSASDSAGAQPETNQAATT